MVLPASVAPRSLSPLVLPAVARHTIAVCVLFAMAIIVPPADAQDVRVGLRVGPTFGFLTDNGAPFTSDIETNANMRLDIHAGAHVVVPLTDHFALQPELLYVQKGGHFSQPRSQSYAVEQYRLSYVQGELLGRHDVSIPGPLSLHAVAGLSVDVALGGALRRDLRTVEIDFGERVALVETGQLRRWDVGALIGVGFGYPVGAASRLALEVRYNPGFRSVFDSSERSAAPRPDGGEEVFPLTGSSLRHDVVTASLSYTLPLGSLF